MQQMIGGSGLRSFWYHFAIMFEALFILTAVDAGTRVARFMLQDGLGNLVPRFRDTSWRGGAWLCTAIMVAGWGAILIMGVTDPLGGINTLFPLFGIANQLLAAIALAVCLAIVAGRGRIGALWVVLVPMAFATVVTVTASMYKIFSSVPAIGYWAQNRAFSAALERGETSFGTAKNVDAMQAVVRNTFIQGTLSVLFLVLTLVVIVTALAATVRSIRSGGSPSAEDPPVPSRIYAPAGLVPTPAEKELVGRWDAAGLTPVRRGHH
jgi:carbon starvation protein